MLHLLTQSYNVFPELAKVHEMLFAEDPNVNASISHMQLLHVLVKLIFHFSLFHIYENLNFILGKNIIHIGCLKSSKMYI